MDRNNAMAKIQSTDEQREIHNSVHQTGKEYWKYHDLGIDYELHDKASIFCTRKC